MDKESVIRQKKLNPNNGFSLNFFIELGFENPLDFLPF